MHQASWEDDQFGHRLEPQLREEPHAAGDPWVDGRAGEHRVVAGDVELSPDARNADAGERRHAPGPEVVHLVFGAVLDHPDVADLLRVDGSGVAEGEHASTRTRATIEASEVDAVGRLGIADAPVSASMPVGQLKGL